jgi:hypothetical protein
MGILEHQGRGAISQNLVQVPLWEVTVDGPPQQT